MLAFLVTKMRNIIKTLTITTNTTIFVTEIVFFKLSTKTADKEKTNPTLHSMPIHCIKTCLNTNCFACGISFIKRLSIITTSKKVISI